MKHLLTTVILALAASAANAACPESMNRDPTFIALAIDAGAPRPKSAEDFSFVNDTTTFAELTAKVGPPDAAKGTNSFVYCLADGTIVTVSSRDGTQIRYVRVNGKTLYKRK
jgi:hypothetical protein